MSKFPSAMSGLVIAPLGDLASILVPALTCWLEVDEETGQETVVVRRGTPDCERRARILSIALGTEVVLR